MFRGAGEVAPGSGSGSWPLDEQIGQLSQRVAALQAEENAFRVRSGIAPANAPQDWSSPSQLGRRLASLAAENEQARRRNAELEHMAAEWKHQVRQSQQEGQESLSLRRQLYLEAADSMLPLWVDEINRETSNEILQARLQLEGLQRQKQAAIHDLSQAQERRGELAQLKSEIHKQQQSLPELYRKLAQDALKPQPSPERGQACGLMQAPLIDTRPPSTANLPMAPQAGHMWAGMSGTHAPNAGWAPGIAPTGMTAQNMFPQSMSPQQMFPSAMNWPMGMMWPWQYPPWAMMWSQPPASGIQAGDLQAGVGSLAAAGGTTPAQVVADTAPQTPVAVATMPVATGAVAQPTIAQRIDKSATTVDQSLTKMAASASTPATMGQSQVSTLVMAPNSSVSAAATSLQKSADTEPAVEMQLKKMQHLLHDAAAVAAESSETEWIGKTLTLPAGGSTQSVGEVVTPSATRNVCELQDTAGAANESSAQSDLGSYIERLIVPLRGVACDPMTFPRNVRDARKGAPWFNEIVSQLDNFARDPNLEEETMEYLSHLPPSQVLAAGFELLRWHMEDCPDSEAEAALGVIDVAKLDELDNVLNQEGSDGNPMPWQDVLEYILSLADQSPDVYEPFCRHAAQCTLPIGRRFRAEQARHFEDALTRSVRMVAAEMQKPVNSSTKGSGKSKQSGVPKVGIGGVGQASGGVAGKGGGQQSRNLSSDEEPGGISAYQQMKMASGGSNAKPKQGAAKKGTGRGGSRSQVEEEEATTSDDVSRIRGAKAAGRGAAKGRQTSLQEDEFTTSEDGGQQMKAKAKAGGKAKSKAKGKAKATAKEESVSAYQSAKQRQQLEAESPTPQIDTTGMSAYQLKKLAMSGATSVTSKSGGSGKIGSMGSSMLSNSRSDVPPWETSAMGSRGGHVSAESEDEIADDDYF